MADQHPPTEETHVSSPADTLEPELFFGLVGPLGSNVEATQEALQNELRKVGYTPIVIHLTQDIVKIIPSLSQGERSTYKNKIDMMNEVVHRSEKKDFLAKIAIASIAARRESQNLERGFTPRHAREFQRPKTAYIIRQLKRKQEVETLQKVYGKKFIQVSIAVGEEEQWISVLSIIAREQPSLPQFTREDVARKLIAQDREEAGVDHGQSTINIHHAGDVFVAGNSNDIERQIGRFIAALFGSNYISPTKDEYGSQLAKVASLRTLDLSRQVGAAIMSDEGDIITLGCNEVPRPHGGNYWEDDANPQRDMERGVEPNKLETTRVIHDFIRAISSLDEVPLTAEEILKNPKFDKILKDAFISDITEFGRITHAEMSALSDAARLGRSTKGATIYVTTFPCHNCAKHLIAAGIRRIVYIEPYTKSKAMELSGDALSMRREDSSKVTIEHFVGISPSRYRDIFEKPKKRRDDDNKVKRWHFGSPTPMVPDKSGTHTLIEAQTLAGFDEVLKKFTSA